jgi:rubrerythrin
MHIIDFAMQMELDGKAFYEKSAQNTPQPELKKILLTLAEEELKHFQFFKRLKDGEFAAAEKELQAPSKTPMTTKTLFKQMADEGKYKSFDAQAKAVWTEALRIEEKVEKIYRDQAAAETDPVRKRLLTTLADEEKSHVYLVDNMLSFMSDPQGFTASNDYKSFMSWEGR